MYAQQHTRVETSRSFKFNLDRRRFTTAVDRLGLGLFQFFVSLYVLHLWSLYVHMGGWLLDLTLIPSSILHHKSLPIIIITITHRTIF